MNKEQLVGTLKQILALARAGKVDQSYAAYQALFTNPEFLQLRHDEQRQAIRLMVHTKIPKKPSAAIVDAHRSAVLPLTEMVSIYDEPADYEMLGMCHLVLGNSESASQMFRAGLTIERERNPASDLCGALMRRVSEI